MALRCCLDSTRHRSGGGPSGRGWPWSSADRRRSLERRRTEASDVVASREPLSASGSDPHVVIVGGGFGGLNAARALDGAPVRVTLLDQRNHHLFQPLLYQVATAALNAADIASPWRSVLRRAKNVTVLLARVDRVDLDRRRLVLAEGELDYDVLIL